jgi:hypothetical protein
MASMTKKQRLGALVRESLERSEGRNSDQLQANRTAAMRFYRGAPLGDEIEGRSQVISMDVADTTNATLAMLRDMLILDAELVVEPEGDEDELLARAESDICSDVLLKDNRGERVLLSAFKDGLLLKNGAIKVEMINDELAVMAVPIENVSYTAGWPYDFQALPFFSERILYSRSDLVQMGLDRKLVSSLPPYSEFDNSTSQARNVVQKQSNDGASKDQDQIECHSAYILADLDDSGTSKRWAVLVAGPETVLEYEEVQVIPYALGSPWLAPHRLTGESIFDRVAQIQVSNTKFLRQWHDNVALINNGRYVYDPNRVNEADIMSPKAGGGIRARDPSAVVPLMVQDITGGIAAAIQFNNQKRTEAVGAALDMSGAEAQLVNKSATAASIEKGNQELISAMIASNFSLTLVLDTYRLIRFYLRNYATRSYLARVSGQVVPVDPTQWPEKRRMYVRCGISPGQKAMQMMALQNHVQLQAQAMSSGLDNELASKQTLYRTQMRVLRMAGVPDPESLAVDPSSMMAQQAAQQKSQAAQQQQQQMAQMQQQMTELQMQLEQAKLAEDARQADDELKFKYWDANLAAELKEAEVTAQGMVDLEKEDRKNRGGLISAAE